MVRDAILSNSPVRILLDQHGNVLQSLHNNVIKQGLVFDPTAHGERQLIDWYYADPRRLAPVEALAVENKVVDWVVNQAQTTEEAVSFEELMGREPGMGAAPQPAA